MSASIEPTKVEKSKKGGVQRESTATAVEPADRKGAESVAAAAGPSKDGKPRTWMEAHGGTVYIGAAFALIALLVVVRSACN